MKLFRGLLALTLVGLLGIAPAVSFAQQSNSALPRIKSSQGNSASTSGVVLIPPGTVTSNGSGNVANASAVATLTATATTYAYISGFRCDPGGSTAAGIAAVTVAGVTGGPLVYTAGSPAGVGLVGTPVNEGFNPPLPASAVNTNISVTMGALGSGNVKASCVIYGLIW